MEKQYNNIELINKIKNCEVGSAEFKKFQTELLENNKKLINFSIAKYGSNLNYEDAFQEASMAMLDSVKTFDTSKGYSFTTYAMNNIQFKFWDLIKKESIVSGLGNLQRKITSAYGNLVNKGNPNPTVTDIANYLNCSEEQVNKIKNAKNIISLDANIRSKKGESNIKVYDMIADDKINILEDSIKKEEYDRLRVAITFLPPSEAEVLKLFYFNNLKQNEIGKIFNMGQSYVSRLISKATSNLKRLMLDYNAKAINDILRLNRRYKALTKALGKEPSLEKLFEVNNFSVQNFVDMAKIACFKFNYPIYKNQMFNKKILDEPAKTILKNTPAKQSNQIIDVCVLNKSKEIIENKYKLPCKNVLNNVNNAIINAVDKSEIILIKK